MFIRFFSSTELLKGDLGTVTVDLDGDGNPNYLLNPLLAELGAHVRMINLAGIDVSVLTCGSGFDQPDIPIAGSSTISSVRQSNNCDAPCWPQSGSLIGECRCRLYPSHTFLAVR
jgi:hypothetical protein